MQIKTGSRTLRQRAQALWLIVVVLVCALIIIGGIAYYIIQALNRLFKPQKQDPDNWSQVTGENPPFSSPAPGMTTTGYYPVFTPSVSSVNGTPAPPVPAGFVYDTVTVYASDTLTTNWTNQIMTFPVNGMDVNLANGMPMETFPDGQKPPQRFYNIVVSKGPVPPGPVTPSTLHK